MSIYKWFDDEETKKRRKKKEEFYNSLPKEKVQDLKKKSIKKVLNVEYEPGSIEIEDNISNELLKNIIDFKDWLDTRKYLKGDLDRIQTWIRILYKRFESVSESLNKETEREELVEEFRKVPTELLEEKERVALQKKLRGTKRTNSDNYYLRKLKLNVDSKLAYAKYYEIIRRILEL